MTSFQKERDSVLSGLQKKPEKVDAIVARYQQYADEWRAKGRVKEAEALEEVIARLKDGRATDPRTLVDVPSPDGPAKESARR